MANQQLVQHFMQQFLEGNAFKTILAARRQAVEVLGEDISRGSSLTKLVDESVEAALIRVAQSIVRETRSTIEIYDRLVNLYQRQPVLNVRSSTSILQQAYSTPIPIAYLASQLAGITSETSVYEPTGGHGALLLGTDPTRVTVNELNPERAADLRVQGYTVTEFDATSYQPEQLHDRIICNPPFGVLKHANGRVKQFEIPNSRRNSTQIDQVIALRALEAMKPDGKAVLILGGKLGQDDDLRSERYNSLESRSFFRVLYDHYNVTQHISIWGALYRKQGAGFPIDLIVIEGRGKSSLLLPAARIPPIFKSFAELKELIPNEQLYELPQSMEARSGRVSGLDDGADSRPDAADEQRRLLETDGTTHRLDDSALDESSGGKSSPNPSTSVQRAEPIEPRPGSTGSQSGLADATSLDAGMGSNVYRVQRSIETTDLYSLPREDSTSITTGSDGAMDHDSRHDESSRVARTTDLRTDDRRLVISGEVRMNNLQALDVPYVPRSKARIAETIIPTNMAAAAQKALDNLERAVGDIDEFVMHRLGYDSTEQLWRYFYAEQIDAIALSFHQRDQGNIFLNGDQTGNGKGRFGAANLIDAFRKGFIPVFVTQKSNLYNTMLNDLADVGKTDFRIFATDNGLRLKLDDGRRLTTGTAAEQEAEMRRIMQEGLGSQYNAIFTTYSQLQTIENEEPFRREFFRSISSRAVFVFDEAHEAGGVSKIGTWKTNAPANRADFVRELVDRSAGSVFMSATSIKNSAVVDLYARRSDARYAVERIENLEKILRDGGVPLQQMFATKFVAAGQMVRRGRSMAGISFDSEIVPVDREIAENISTIMRSINRFDEAKQTALKEVGKQLKAEAKALSQDNSIGQVGLKSTNFTSLMHNAIDQSLLAQKAEATVQSAISAIQRGEKPIIAVASTMDSFIAWYTKENGIKPDSAISITFGDVLQRYLERSRDILVTDYDGVTIRRRLTDKELGDDGIEAYQDALNWIEATDLSQIPLSSIDYIRWRLTQEGYRVDEVTGRENILEYGQQGKTSYGLRPEREVSPQGRIDIVNRFNRGTLDVLILNRSGATGINLHSSERFVDQRPRHMIVAQAERDVNLVMQMLGRINRFGQVNKPRFTLLMSDLPAEKRLGALLAKKMAELNANVTAAPDSELSIANVVDFMNVYGEEVVIDLLDEDLELQGKLGYPLKGSDDSEIAVVKRVTGRIPLLTLNEQENLYTLIEAETRDLIAQKEAMGESVLRADQLDLDARTIARMEVIPDTSEIESEFTGSVCLEVVDAKVAAKPLTQLEVINSVRESLNLQRIKQVEEHDFQSVEAIAYEHTQTLLAQVERDTNSYRQQALLVAPSEAKRDKLNTRLDEQLMHLRRILQTLPPGTPVQVISPEGNVFYGVVSQVSQKSYRGSPSAPTNWRAQILIDHRSRQLTIPFSKLNRGKDDTAMLVTRQAENWSGENIYEAFDSRQQESQRTEVQIFTGNPIKAFEKFPKGKFVNYTTAQGEVLQGLVMPASFDIQQVLREEPVFFRESSQIQAFLTEATQYRGAVKTSDELLTIKTQFSARTGESKAVGFVLQTVKSGLGNQYSLDPELIQAAGAEFYSISDRMECIVSAERIDAVLTLMLKEKRWILAAFDFKEKARDLLNIKLPEFRTVESVPIPQMPERSASVRVLSAESQIGTSEKNIARFLDRANLAEAVMSNSEFYLQIQNEPFIPLTIERHDADLHFIHWLKDQAGDLFIDSEMIFQLSEDGHLKLKEVAVQNVLIGGETRGLDPAFARLFSQNILDQGFAQGVVKLEASSNEQPQQKLADWQILDRTGLKAHVLSYLALKDEHPNALVFQKSKSQAFYEAMFSDARTIGRELDLVVVSRDLGGAAKQAPLLLIPAKATVMKRFTEYLQDQGFRVVVDEGQTLTPSLQPLAEQLRGIDLEIVAERLGLERDLTNPQKWRSEEHIIRIQEGKFQDWAMSTEGEGAIELVMHIQNADLKAAIAWLSRQFLTQPNEQFPQAMEAHWEAVRADLVEVRELPGDWIDRLHTRGLIYADAQKNAVFLRYPEQQHGISWSRGHPIGAELQRASEPASQDLAPRTSNEQGWFWLRQGEGEVQRIVLVGSAIDALSLAALERKKGQNSGATVYLATDRSVPTQALRSHLEQGRQVIVAFDADKAGERLAWQVAHEVLGVRRMSPAVGKDWNDRLRAEKHPDQSQPLAERGNQETLKLMWKWYRVSGELAKSEAYRQRITEVAREVVDGTLLSEKAIAAMERDFQAYGEVSPNQQSAQNLNSQQIRASVEGGL